MIPLITIVLEPVGSQTGSQGTTCDWVLYSMLGKQQTEVIAFLAVLELAGGTGPDEEEWENECAYSPLRLLKIVYFETLKT